MKTIKTQNQIILDYMMNHKKGITPQDALRVAGCMRLGARIWELRNIYLIDIITENVTSKTKTGTMATYASYKLKDKSQPTIYKALDAMNARKTA